MTTEFNDASHYGFFMTGTSLTSASGKYLRQSELTLAALRAAGLLDNMEDGTTPPSIDKLWLDKNFDPAVLKEWNPIGAAWEQVTSQTLFGRIPWRGEWVSSAIYRRADVVSYQGRIWIAVQSSQNHTPAEDAYWDLFLDSVADNAVSTAKIQDQAVSTAKLADNGVTNVKLADMATSTFKGRATAGIGDPEDLTVEQAIEVLGLTYIKDYGSHTTDLRKFRPSPILDPIDWTATLQAAGVSSARNIRVPSDVDIVFTDQWSIETDTQKWVGESMDNRSYLRRTTDVDEAAILVMGERCGMRNIGLKGVDYTNAGGVTKTAANAGILVARPSGEPADLDFEFRDGYISEFYYLVDGLGRGVSVIDSLMTACRYGVNFGWPAAGTFIKDRFVGDGDTNGFRRQVVRGCEFHSIAVAGVRNRGYNAANIKCVIENNKSNFGKGMFVGHLGDGSVIQGNAIQNANFIGYELDGGTNWIMRNNSMVSDLTPAGSPGPFSQPESFIKMTGQHAGFVMDGFQGGYCTSHGIDMRSGDFKGILRNIDLREVGTAGPGTIAGVMVIGTGANTEIMVDGVTLRNAVAAQGVVRAHVAGEVIKHRGIVALGAATPATIGPGTFTPV